VKVISYVKLSKTLLSLEHLSGYLLIFLTVYFSMTPSVGKFIVPEKDAGGSI
jgi:hypothetical protein